MGLEFPEPVAVEDPEPDSVAIPQGARTGGGLEARLGAEELEPSVAPKHPGIVREQRLVLGERMGEERVQPPRVRLECAGAGIGEEAHEPPELPGGVSRSETATARSRLAA